MTESNITIAQKIKLDPIIDIAKQIGLKEEDLSLYGPYIAKINAGSIKKMKKCVF